METYLIVLYFVVGFIVASTLVYLDPPKGGLDGKTEWFLFFVNFLAFVLIWPVGVNTILILAVISKGRER
ncbi:hypothetical protein [Salinivibrio phage CW02]|uniref:Uncharacterized protein n=1 Tax=Salinivibrio phage CW02 TaxID=1161935 RepID=H9D1I5_9CAUD|nr:hypothetical protein F490_gp10 [Salinivibrio phage CW02]AFE86227.1 hypothetical protein [Salinivibrio phage CW02]